MPRVISSLFFAPALGVQQFPLRNKLGTGPHRSGDRQGTGWGENPTGIGDRSFDLAQDGLPTGYRASPSKGGNDVHMKIDG